CLTRHAQHCAFPRPGIADDKREIAPIRNNLTTATTAMTVGLTTPTPPMPASLTTAATTPTPADAVTDEAQLDGDLATAKKRLTCTHRWGAKSDGPGPRAGSCRTRSAA